ncbi:MAG TPA: PAC2 family protein [Acidimicrobiales bacterium]|nr:PAC2 family protein [Acidimicrobiales bacterium]
MPLVTRHGVDPPAHPVLVVALEGWIDAGFAAATAAATVLEQVTTERYATFDADELVDLRSRRPRMRIDDGVRADVTWSEPQLLVGVDRLGAGIALLVGPEPDYRWRAFSAEVTALAREIGCRLVVGLGGFPTATPHTRPVRLASTASSETLARAVGFMPGSIDVPAGIADVVGLECSRAGIASVGLWARVPHYVAGMAFPPAALALVEGLVSISGLVVDVEELRESAEAGRHRVDELIAQSSEHLAMVRRLEDQFEEGDELEVPGADDLPSGDEIAAELERYLRGES